MIRSCLVLALTVCVTLLAGCSSLAKLKMEAHLEHLDKNLADLKAEEEQLETQRAELREFVKKANERSDAFMDLQRDQDKVIGRFEEALRKGFVSVQSLQESLAVLTREKEYIRAQIQSAEADLVAKAAWERHLDQVNKEKRLVEEAIAKMQEIERQTLAGAQGRR